MGKNYRKQGNSSKAMKYMIRADIKVNGTVQRKDIIGAIMGQTEGLLGDDLELRKLQRSARVGHVDVETEVKNGKVHGNIFIPSSMDNVETAIIASALETIERIGPCDAVITVVEINDVRATKRTSVVERAKELLLTMVNSGEAASKTVVEEVRAVLTTGTATSYHGLTSGPNVESSDSLIIVEGRNDVRNLLNHGIKNAISADGAGDIKQELIDLANGKQTVILAIDGDRGGEMLFLQLEDMLKIDYVAQAPPGQEWELLPQKTITMCLQKKVESKRLKKDLEAQIARDNEKYTKDDSWKEELEEQSEQAPADIQELFDKLDEMKKNTAMFLFKDGSFSEDVISASKLSDSIKEAENVEAIILNGSITGTILSKIEGSEISTLIGTKEGKDFAQNEELSVWFSSIHR